MCVVVGAREATVLVEELEVVSREVNRFLGGLGE